MHDVRKSLVPVESLRHLRCICPGAGLWNSFRLLHVWFHCTDSCPDNRSAESGNRYSIYPAICDRPLPADCGCRKLRRSRPADSRKSYLAGDGNLVSERGWGGHRSIGYIFPAESVFCCVKKWCQKHLETFHETIPLFETSGGPISHQTAFDIEPNSLIIL